MPFLPSKYSVNFINAERTSGPTRPHWLSGLSPSPDSAHLRNGLLPGGYTGSGGRRLQEIEEIQVGELVWAWHEQTGDLADGFDRLGMGERRDEKKRPKRKIFPG